MKTLVDEIRGMVRDARARGVYPVFSDSASDILGRSCWFEDDDAELFKLFTIIADRIEREHMELPMLEGEPLKVGDKVDGYSQEGAEVVAIMNEKMVVVRSTVKGGHGYHDDAYPLLLWYVDDLKRHRQEVLDADGVPIHVGDTVYSQDGKSFTVQEIMVDYDDDERTVFCGEYRKGFKVWRIATDLTHKQPDTLERIEADAKKAYEVYWGCNFMLSCEYCPAKVDGKKPHERYATGGNCMRAQYLDLLRRQREVLERGQA